MGFTKAYDGETHAMFPSVIEPTGTSADAPLTKKSDEGVGYDIEIDGEGHRVGGRAGSYAARERNAPNSTALVSRFARPLVLTAAAAFSDRECPLQVVTGLSVNDHPDHHNRLLDQLVGFHKIRIANPGKPPETRNIHIRKIRVFPKPMGTFARLVMGPDGAITHREYVNAKIGIVDIGFRTTDTIIVDRLRYCNRGADTFDIGAALCFDTITKRLRQESGVSVDMETLFQGLKLGYVKIKGQEYRLSNLKQQIYRQTALEIADRVNYLWKDDWDIDVIIISGGGGHLLAGTVGDQFKGEVHLLENSIDSRLNNVMGYYLLGINTWGASGLCLRPG